MSGARLMIRDYVATALVVLIVIAYLGRTWDQFPVLHDPERMAGVGLTLAFPAFIIIRGADILDVTGLIEVVFAVMSLLLGFATLVFARTAVAEAFLAAFMASIIVVWATALLDHLGVLPSHHVSGAAR